MRRYRNWIILAVVAALVAVSVYFIVPPSEKTHLGLDLQGGVEVVYTAKTADGKQPTADQMTQTLGIIDKRVNGLGVTESQVQQQGTDQISVALPGVKNAEAAIAIVGKTAQLEFFKDYPDIRLVGPLGSRDEALKAGATAGIPKADLAAFREGAANTQKYALIQADPGTIGNDTTQWFIYKRPPSMTGDAIKSAAQGYDQFGRPNVSIKFTDTGQKQFQEITRELYRIGLLKGEAQTFAIVLDNVMESDPRIDYTDANLRDGINGDAEITGSFTVQEAKDLALVLNTGALPVHLEPTYQQQISATLGKDSLRAGLIAGMVGLLLVLVYMLVYYRFLGLIADIALIVYGILLWGLFNAIPVTLTLPGIAGMILTIGVAADANVVIFERIKEEVRRGKTVRSAVNSGYARGFKTILDANILTLLTALVLFEFATAQPKGFAFTLILGVLVSMFTAVLATRALLGVLGDFAFFNRPSFMGVSAGQIEAAQAAATAEGGQRRGERRPSGPAAPVPNGAPAAAAVRRPSSSRKKKKRR